MEPEKSVVSAARAHESGTQSQSCATGVPRRSRLSFARWRRTGPPLIRALDRRTNGWTTMVSPRPCEGSGRGRHFSRSIFLAPFVSHASCRARRVPLAVSPCPGPAAFSRTSLLRAHPKRSVSVAEEAGPRGRDCVCLTARASKASCVLAPGRKGALSQMRAPAVRLPASRSCDGLFRGVSGGWAHVPV